MSVWNQREATSLQCCLFSSRDVTLDVQQLNNTLVESSRFLLLQDSPFPGMSTCDAAASRAQLKETLATVLEKLHTSASTGQSYGRRSTFQFLSFHSEGTFLQGHVALQDPAAD